MDPIPSGSRGPVLLRLQGSRSTDDASAVLVAAQQWSFTIEHSRQHPDITLSEVRTQAGSSSSVRLTSATVSHSTDRLSLFPAKSSEAGSSIDAGIVSAQRFLHQYNPDIDIPDYILSQLIYDNALALEDTAHELDGSLGLADAQAIAVLGPVVLGQKRTYAVICIGGGNRDCLLLHQLEAVPSDSEEASASDRERSPSTHPEDKAKVTENSKLRFIPAHQVERKYKTPILQIALSPNKEHIAVRGHSGANFLALKHKYGQDGTPRLFLETVHQVEYGINGSCQHLDICFSKSLPTLAASVDRLGNIDLHHLAADHRSSTQTGRASNSPATNPTEIGANASDDADSQECESGPSAAGSERPVPPTSSLVTRRVSAQLLRQAMPENADAIAEDAADQPAQTTDTSTLSKQGPFKIIFGSDEHNLFLLTRHALLHIQLEATTDAPQADNTQQITILLRSAFCLTSFRRARFFSVAAAETESCQSLLAVCSSDSLYWFDLHRPSKPLFATAHHRGDDPTLFLAQLPPVRQQEPAASQQDQNYQALRWFLSSRRNDMVSCYTVTPQPHQGSGTDLIRSTDETSTSSRVRYVLDPAPVLVPSVLSDQELRRPAAPPLFVVLDELLRQKQGPNILLRLDVTHRGALLAHTLGMDVRDSPSRSSRYQVRSLELEVMQPSTGTLLYIDEVNETTSLHYCADPLSGVKTKLVNYGKLYRSLFSPEDHAASQLGRTDITKVTKNNRLLLHSLLIEPIKGNAAVHAAMISLGELIRDISRYQKDGDQDQAARQGKKSSWSTALDLTDSNGPTVETARAILDVRSDIRHALSSLGSSSSQRLWSRAASVVSDCHTMGMVAGNGHFSNLPLHSNDVVENVLSLSDSKIDPLPYLPTKSAVKDWTGTERSTTQASLRKASRRMMLDMALETKIFVRPKARILDEGAPTQRPQRRQGTNWTASEHRDIYNFVEEQGGTIPPPHIGSVGLSFFAPLRGGDIEAAAGTDAEGSKPGLNEAEVESLLPSTSSTARLLLAEWQLGEDPADYTYLDPFEGLHRLPRASRMVGPTARARSRSFSRASSASTEDRSRSRSRSRSRKQSAAPSFSQSGAYASQTNSQGTVSSYPSSSVGYSQAGGPSSSAPPTLISRRKRQHNDIVSRSQPIRAPAQNLDQTPGRNTPTTMRTSAAPAQSQPAATRLTPTVLPPSSQVGTPTQSRFGASTQIEAGRFGARPAKPDKPAKKKKRASGF